MSKVDEKSGTNDKEDPEAEAMNLFVLQECKIKTYSNKYPYEFLKEEEEKLIIPKNYMSRLKNATFSIDRRSVAN